MRTVAFLVAISVGATGCAVAAARGPEPGPVRADHRPDCNTGKGGVVADGLGATVLGISTLGLAAADEGAIAALTGLATAGLIGSAVAGSRSADRCQEALEEWEGLLTARRVEELEDERRTVRAARGVAVRPPPATTAAVTPTPPVGKPPVVTPTTPPVVKPTTPPVVKPTPAADPGDGDGDDADDAAAAGDGDWSAFWREVAP
ncbi:MAG: hypothetical protein JNK64_30810 [Myxococcales bacterium]|nr:hypothetical protein [Myxococcales bacterium]